MKLPWWGYVIGAGVAVGALATVTAGVAVAETLSLDGPRPVLKLGSTGEAVSRWRQIVGLPAGDTFDAATDAATKSWQKSKGLTADGIVGPKSWTTALGPAGASKLAGSAIAATGPALPPVEHAASGDSGRTWAKGLPKNATPERDGAVIAAVKAGFYIMPAWVPVSYVKDGKSVTIFAWDDSLSIGFEDRIRADVRHDTAQRIADLLDCTLPTTRMSDAAYAGAQVKLNPQTINAGWQSVKDQNSTANPLNVMSTTACMIDASDHVSAARLKAGMSGPFGGEARDVGKDWVNTERLWEGGKMAMKVGLPAAANFGWHWDQAGLKSPGGMKVLQSVGLAHNLLHTDYSQVLVLYRKECVVDGANRSVEEVLLDPDKAYLLSDEVLKGTACKVVRYPAVPPGG